MAASRLDMFWAEATDVNAATESPTKSARESLFAYLMTQLHLLRRFHAGTNMPILSSPIPDRPLGFHRINGCGLSWFRFGQERARFTRCSRVWPRPDGFSGRSTSFFARRMESARPSLEIRALEEGWLLTRLTVEQPAVNHSPAEIQCDLVVEAAPSSGTGIIALMIVRPTTESISSRPPI
jgi:hypothetical protein